MDCLFCAIVDKKIPADVVYEDEEIMAFKDINPVAPHHVLVIPKKHLPSILDLSKEEVLGGRILSTINTIAKKLKLEKKGFRVVNNMGDEGGQTVDHVHFHLIGGRSLTWPPG